MSDESCHSQKVREAISAGKLPNQPPERAWGGPGSGAICTICNTPVTPAQVELELEFASDGDGAGPRLYHLHSLCYAAWEFERFNLPTASNGQRDPTRLGTRPAGLNGTAKLASGMKPNSNTLLAENDMANITSHERATPPGRGRGR